MKNILALFSIFVAVFGLSVSGFPSVFAQQSTDAQAIASESAIIADVNLVNQVIVKQEGRLFTLGVNIQNKIGTQDGVMYGVQTYQTVDGKRVLVDEFAILDPLSIKQNEYVYKEFTYPLPTSISGTIELFAFLKTDKGILLSVAPLGTKEIEPALVAVDIENCTVDAAAQNVSCTLINKTKKDQSVVVVTQVKQGDSVFAPIAENLPPQVIVLASQEEKVVTQKIDPLIFSKNAFFETVLIDQKDSSLVERVTVLYASKERSRSIDNILIEQKSAKEYTVKIVSLGNISGNAQVTLSDAKKVCATQDVVLSGPITTVSFVLKKACNTISVSTVITDNEGTVLDTKNISHITLFPEKSNTNIILSFLALLVFVLTYVILKNKRN